MDVASNTMAIYPQFLSWEHLSFKPRIDVFPDYVSPYCFNNSFFLCPPCIHLLPDTHLFLYSDFKILLLSFPLLTKPIWWLRPISQSTVESRLCPGQCQERRVKLSAVPENPSHSAHTDLAASLMLPTNGSTRICILPWEKSRASIRQTNHAAGICVMKSTSARGSGMVWINPTPLPGANSPGITLFSSVIFILVASQRLGTATRGWPRHD